MPSSTDECSSIFQLPLEVLDYRSISRREGIPVVNAFVLELHFVTDKKPASAKGNKL